MQIVSLNTGNPLSLKSASYSINVPDQVAVISFSWAYSTADVNGSYFDMARYSVGGTVNNFFPEGTGIGSSHVAQNGSTSGSLSLGDVSGKSFSIIQEARDNQLGSGTITITNFLASYRNMSQLVLESAPKLTQSGSSLTCAPGSYSFLNGGATKEVANLSSVTYTLEVDGVEVSRATAGTSALPSMLAELKNTYSATATLTGATFDMAGKTNYNASCKVMVTQGTTVLSANSETIADAASIAAKAKAASEAEAARQIALAEFNSKENRLKRMAKAAQAGN